ncbi:MAG: diadenylate cyclase CdaA [Clostridia bacterium]|nr:diadenylate cyclase CdaA [Clostridia bacterium]
MRNAIDVVFAYLKMIQPSDYVDILITAVIIYSMITWLRETRAMQLVKGIIVVFAVLAISNWFHLTIINYILSAIVQVGVFALVVLFQPELRSLLERLGRSRVGKLIDYATNEVGQAEYGEETVIGNVVDAVTEMSREKTGALIVIERDTKLGDHTKRGTKIDADVSKELLQNIFFKNSPLHDGAVIIRNGRIHSAGCFLPLTSNDNLSTELGTRHRAALGISEVSDAMIIVVSEETGKISIALGGSLTRNVTKEPLRHALERFFDSEAERNFVKFFNNLKKGGAFNGKAKK